MKNAEHNRIKNCKTTGAIYTPISLVNTIYTFGGHNFSAPPGRIADIACGDGAFLTPLVRYLIKEAQEKEQDPREILKTRLFGADIDEKAINDCKRALDESAAIENVFDVQWTLETIDVAQKSFLEKYKNTFDCVVGNPPYVRIQNLSKKTKEFLQTLPLANKGATDLYLAFTNIALHCLKSNGQLLYIMPRSWLSSNAGKSLRQFCSNGKLKSILDFGTTQVFPGARTYVAVVDIRKGETFPSIHVTHAESQIQLEIPREELTNPLPHLHPKQSNHIPTKCLGEIARIATGIATLADGWFIGRIEKEENEKTILRTKAGMVEVESSALQNIVKASTLRHNNEDQGLRIFFPYQKQNGIYRIIKENQLKEMWPLAFAYFERIRPILNTRERGNQRYEAWYAYGRTQGINGLWGDKLITSSINKEPKFFRMQNPNTLFYNGYGVFYENLSALQNQLNSQKMQYFVQTHGRPFQQGWWSYAKSIIKHFPIEIDPPKN